MAGGQGRETGASPIQSCLEQVYDTMKMLGKDLEGDQEIFI